MAYVSRLVKLEAGSGGRRHPTSVTCRWTTVGNGAGKLLQLNTYGSSDRQETEKLSQTIQLNREIAAELKRLIEQTFPGV